MSVSVGIDLGTTFSAVAYIDPKTRQPTIIPNTEGRRITPSVIQFLDGEMIFGSEAEEAMAAGESDCAATFKREMGNDEPYCYIDGTAYTSEQLSGFLLRHLKEDAEAVLGDTIADAVITVPAYFYSREREATINAAKAAGLKVRKIIDEPNAAAMAYGLEHWRENARILVYDLGGGTFDVTLVVMGKDGQLSTVTTRGNHKLGGRDWDARIEDILFDRFEADTGLDLHEDPESCAIVRGLAEGVKKQLSVMAVVRAAASFPGFGKSTVSITRQEFESGTSDLLEQTGALCQAVLDEAGLSSKDVTDVLLVGGSTRMLQVPAYLQKIFGKRPIAHVNPDEAVALGAAIQSSKREEAYTALSVQVVDGKKKTDMGSVGLSVRAAVKPSKKLTSVSVMTLRETTAHAMGMIALSQDMTHYINDTIIPANHPRPVRVAKAFRFFTSRRKENIMEIYVVQGSHENPLDNSIPYKYVVTGIRHIRERKGETVIKVQYSYDGNGVINVQARQENDSVNLPIRKEPIPDDMSQYGRPVNPDDLKRVEPLNVVIAVDVSGSMSGPPIENAKSAIRNFIASMDFSYTRLAILAVSDRTEVICGLTDNERRCLNAVDAITCGSVGYGNADHPFGEIERILKNEDGRLFSIVLADGVWDHQDRAVAASKACNKAGIETAAIGFGSADQNFLKAISSEDANALFVQQSELSSAFGSIAQSIVGDGSATNDYLSSATDVDTWEN